MEKQMSAIPAFYACYLLRSTVRHASQYIGSTPHPKRRLAQHNGDVAGGAARTSRDNLRPWEMTCLVTGFPSKVAALQFEWAWQNPHLTRHVSSASRMTQAKATVRISPKTGRARTRTARPRLCLTDRLANLHLLLRSSSFERWPLNVTFYSRDVYRVWEKWTKQQVERLRPGIVVALDDSATTTKSIDPLVPPTASGIHAIDVGYSACKPHIEKGRRAFENADWLHCSVCKEGLPASGAMTLVCPAEGCSALSHMECLSATFLRANNDNSDAIVPTSGQCPSCDAKLQWIDLVKELSLRMRGQKELEAMFKKRRGTKKQVEAAVAGVDDTPATEDDEMDDVLPNDDLDGWHELPESSDIEVDEPRVRSDHSPVTRPTAFIQQKPAAVFSEPIIEDSDWDDAEVIN